MKGERENFQSTRLTLTWGWSCTISQTLCIIMALSPSLPLSPAVESLLLPLSFTHKIKLTLLWSISTLNEHKIITNLTAYIMNDAYDVQLIFVHFFFFILLDWLRNTFPVIRMQWRERWQVVNPLSPCWPEICLERTFFFFFFFSFFITLTMKSCKHLCSYLMLIVLLRRRER